MAASAGGGTDAGGRWVLHHSRVCFRLLLRRLLLTRGHAIGPFGGRGKIEQLTHDSTPAGDYRPSARPTRTIAAAAPGCSRRESAGAAAHRFGLARNGSRRRVGDDYEFSSPAASMSTNAADRAGGGSRYPTTPAFAASNSTSARHSHRVRWTPAAAVLVVPAAELFPRRDFGRPRGVPMI